MKAVEILKAMSESDSLVDEVLGYLNYGMFDEWDCDLPEGIKLGFGGPELRIAARSGLVLAKHHDSGRHLGTRVELNLDYRGDR